MNIASVLATVNQFHTSISGNFIAIYVLTLGFPVWKRINHPLAILTKHIPRYGLKRQYSASETPESNVIGLISCISRRSMAYFVYALTILTTASVSAIHAMPDNQLKQCLKKYILL